MICRFKKEGRKQVRIQGTKKEKARILRRMKQIPREKETAQSNRGLGIHNLWGRVTASYDECGHP
jgi:hypothetical protein